MKIIRWAGLAVLLLLIAGLVNEFRPVGAVPALQTIGSTAGGSGGSQRVPWPATGQAAIGGEQGGAIASTPNARARPIASVAKVMTALVVLDEKPLNVGGQGPAITMTPYDVTEYQQDKAAQQSVVAVQAGEQLTEYQALQALLIPSGNNIASLLARWASGSVDAHVKKMNARARAMGMHRTRFADVSGFSERTVSTPSDMVRLGQAALDNPVLAGIVQQEQVMLPVAGLQINVNYALGQSGIFGIKTGNTPSGGAIYLFAGDVQVSGGARIYVVGAVQDLPTLQDAFTAAKTLLGAAGTSLHVLRVVSKDQPVGRYDLPWGGGSRVVATQDLDVYVWAGTTVHRALRARAVSPPVAPGTK
ncbi:MAG: D-alanyl-D-alanine carboxypeptidase, partial [Candidatus Dormibacteraeota bacterium]|nr:D-alanyl-D-alanine carboxypeptidase [Candidatus Dormibacteraeota bacterium]